MGYVAVQCRTCGAAHERAPFATSNRCAACAQVVAFLQKQLPDRNPGFVQAEMARRGVARAADVVADIAAAAGDARRTSPDWELLWDQKRKRAHMSAQARHAQQEAEATVYKQIMAMYRRAHAPGAVQQPT